MPGRARRILDGPHAVIAGVMLDLGQAQRFHDRRDVVAEPAAEPLLQAVPATNRVVRRAPPGFDGAVRRWLLLVGVTQRHPVAALLQHRVQVLDAPKLVAQLGRAHLDDQGRRIGILVAPGLEVRLSGRRGQDPRILSGPRPGGAAAHCGAPFGADAGDYGSRYMTSRVVIRDYPWACARQPSRRPAGPAPR